MQIEAVKTKRGLLIPLIGELKDIRQERVVLDVRLVDDEAGSAAWASAIRCRIKEAVHAVEPGAEIILYGSRARGDARADSDWDLLILLDGTVDRRRKRSVQDRLYDLELDLEEVLISTIVSREEWASPLYRAMPFRHNVERDGLVL